MGLGVGVGLGLGVGVGSEALLNAIKLAARAVDAIGHAVSKLAVVVHTALAALGVAGTGIPD